MSKRILRIIAVTSIFSMLLPTLANATIVRMETSLGSIDVNLYDETTPETVANFLSYVSSDAYVNTFIQRSIENFVIQGGGYTYSGTLPVTAITKGSTVVNEPEYSNVRGTIAMAKIGGEPNSATNQWFFNLANNSAGSPQLDTQNGGFTVFGEVMLDDMDVVDAIANVTVRNKGGAFGSLPLRDYSDDDHSNNVDPDADNFILVSAITVIDAAADTAADASPTPNTLIDTPAPTTPSTGDSSGGGGGGSIEILLLALLGCGLRVRRRSVASA